MAKYISQRMMTIATNFFTYFDDHRAAGAVNLPVDFGQEMMIPVSAF